MGLIPAAGAGRIPSDAVQTLQEGPGGRGDGLRGVPASITPRDGETVNVLQTDATSGSAAAE